MPVYQENGVMIRTSVRIFIPDGQTAERGQYKVGGTMLQQAVVSQKPNMLASLRLLLKRYSYRMEQTHVA